METKSAILLLTLVTLVILHCSSADRTVVFIRRETAVGQNVFLRGGKCLCLYTVSIIFLLKKEYDSADDDAVVCNSMRMTFVMTRGQQNFV